MTKKNAAAVALGRLGGRVKSEAKRAANRRNAQTRWAMWWIELCDCTQDGNPNANDHHSECVGRVAWERKKKEQASGR